MPVCDGCILSYVDRKLAYCAVGPIAIVRLYSSVYVCGAVSLVVKGRQFWNYSRSKGRQLQKTYSGVKAEASHKNVDSRHDWDLSGVESCDAVSLGESFPTFRRNAVPSSSRITASRLRTRCLCFNLYG